MSEVTLTDAQYEEAVRILWKHNQFRAGVLVCDEDDLHEYLVQDGLIKQDPEANTDFDPDAFEWLSDESIDRLRKTQLDYVIKSDGKDIDS